MKLFIILFILLVLGAVTLWGNTLRCMSAENECPGFCRQVTVTCTEISNLRCLRGWGCQAPDAGGYKQDIEQWFKGLKK